MPCWSAPPGRWVRRTWEPSGISSAGSGQKPTGAWMTKERRHAARSRNWPLTHADAGPEEASRTAMTTKPASAPPSLFVCFVLMLIPFTCLLWYHVPPLLGSRLMAKFDNHRHSARDVADRPPGWLSWLTLRNHCQPRNDLEIVRAASPRGRHAGSTPHGPTSRPPPEPGRGTR
jgi:hypothetical protein